MPRRIRSAELETRTARLRLKVRRKPYALQVGSGIHLLYRRNKNAGTWVVKAASGEGRYWTHAFAHADDLEAASGGAIMDFWQAVDHVRAVDRDRWEGDAPLTVGAAVDQYEADLRARNADPGNAARIRAHLPDRIAAEFVSNLTERDLQYIRDGMVTKGLARDSVNRTGRAFKAALSLAARRDTRIRSNLVWRYGLAALPNAAAARNVILADDKVRELVGAAYAVDSAFGLMVEVAAVTGSRVSQLARLEVQDLQDDRTAPRLMMPSSRKGRGRKVERRPVPIPPGLAAKLKAASGGRAAEAPLLLRQIGDRWRKGDHARPFQKAAITAGLDPAEVTLYALRHSSVVRALLAGVPVRVVAATHDTSIVMIERTYSKHISDPADALSRRALLDLTAERDPKVVALR
jgi:integrase